MRLTSLAAVGVSVLMFSEFAPALAVDPASAVRGSVGVSLEELALNTPLGALSFGLNAGLLLLSGVLAIYFARVNSRARKGRSPTVPTAMSTGSHSHSAIMQRS
jgi:hypothetical protein